jgi:predicted RNA polymerase sigma factor
LDGLILPPPACQCEPEYHEPALAEYPPLPAVRADLLERLGRNEEAAAEYKRAALLTANTRWRAELMRRAEVCAAT